MSKSVQFCSVKQPTHVKVAWKIICPITHWSGLQFSKETHQIKQQFRSSVEYKIVETFVTMTGKLLPCKHVTFCLMNASGIYSSKIGEVFVCVCVSESGPITRLNVFQDRSLDPGWVRDESGPGVHMLWHRRSKRWKSVWHCRDRWTQWHIRALGAQAGPTPGCRSNAIRNWREGMSVECVSACERDYCTLYGQKYVDDIVNIIWIHISGVVVFHV